ncbi:serine hydrolase domain-containing protein [Cryptosporangium japonicum]
MKRILIISTALATLASVAAAHPPPLLHQDANALIRQGAPSVIAEVVTPDGSATVRAGAVPKHAKFRIGSATKTFTAAVALQLVGEGRLGLEDPVERWLPGVVRGHGNDGRRITVRQLLQQTSGLPNYAARITFLGSKKDYDAEALTATTPAHLLALALSQPPAFAPGTRWDYSNTNYVLAGMVIERVTGHGWESEVERRILRPLRLRDTSVPRTELDVPAPHAVGYHRFPAGQEQFGPRVDTTRFSPTWADAAGSMISTTSDLNRFFRALLGGRVLAPAQLAEMTTTVPAPPFADAWKNPRYGLGLQWSETPCGGMWSHSGDIPGYSTRDGISEDGTRSVVVSINDDTLRPEPGELDPTTDLVNHALCGS